MQLHPDPGPGEVVAHQPDLLAQDLRREGAGRTGAQHPAVAEHVVQAVPVADPGGRFRVQYGHPAEARFGPLPQFQLEGEPPGFEERQRGRVAVDEVPHLGVGVLGGLLHGDAAEPVRELLGVGAQPAEECPVGRLALPAVAVHRDHVLADHHGDAERARLPGQGEAEIAAGRPGGTECRHVHRQRGGEPADGGGEFDVSVVRFAAEVDQPGEPLRHQDRRGDPQRVERVVLAPRPPGAAVIRAEQYASVLAGRRERRRRAGPGAPADLLLGEAGCTEVAHGDTTPASFGKALACQTASSPAT